MASIVNPDSLERADAAAAGVTVQAVQVIKA
jgi:hypothetical protein